MVWFQVTGGSMYFSTKYYEVLMSSYRVLNIQSWRKKYWMLPSMVKISSKVLGNIRPPVIPLSRHVPLGRTNRTCIVCVHIDWAMSQQWKGYYPFCTLYSTVVNISVIRFNIKKICVSPTEWIYLFIWFFGINGDYFSPKQHYHLSVCLCFLCVMNSVPLYCLDKLHASEG
jgi:hypothetical protein